MPNIIRHNGRKVIVGILASLPVGHIGLHAKQTVLDLTHRFVCGYREDIDGQHQVPAYIAQLRDHVILDITGIILHIQHPPEPFIDLEAVFGKLHGLGTDPILEAAPLFGKCLHIERKALGFICPEEIPEDL